MPLFPPPLGVAGLLALGVRFWYRLAVLATVPAGYWRLGESSGTVATDEMGANNGTYVNTTLGVAGALMGDLNTAITLSGTSQYVNFGAAPFPGDVVSFACWFKRGGTGAEQRLIANQDATGALVGFDSTDHVGLRNLANQSIIVATGTITDSNWHHLVITKNGATASDAKIYVDGAAVASTFTNITLPSTTQSWFLGYWMNTAGAVSLDEAAIWNRALSAAEVAALYRIGSGT